MIGELLIQHSRLTTTDLGLTMTIDMKKAVTSYQGLEAHSQGTIPYTCNPTPPNNLHLRMCRTSQ